MKPKSWRGGIWGQSAAFLVLAAVSWLIAGALDMKTQFEIVAWNGRIEWTVGITTIDARTRIADVNTITVSAQAGVQPTGGGVIKVFGPTGPVGQWRLPAHFSFPHRPNPPVGDWWVDERAPTATVFAASADLGQEFTLRGVIAGRQHQHLIVELGGNPGFACAFRRGFLNNDLLILDNQGTVLASGSLDPQPLGRMAAAAATVLRAVSGGAALLALWLIIGVLRPRIAGDVPQMRPAGFAVAMTLLCLAGTGLATWTAIDIFENLPHLPDEVVYQLQGRWLLTGHLTGEEPPCSEHFTVPLTYIRNGRWIGHYPPMWPLFLVPGIAVGAPWLVPALLRIPHILLIGLLGLRLGGRWTGLAAAAAALASPLALLLFGSRMPHTGSATLLLAGILLCLPRVQPDTPSTSQWRWICAGLTFGLAFGMRPLTAVAVALPIGVFHLGETMAGRRQWIDSAWLIVSGTATCVPTLVANHSITGSPWIFPYSLAEGSMYSLQNVAFGIRNLDALLASLGPLVHGWGWSWLSGPVSSALPMAFVAVVFLSGQSTKEDRLLIIVAAAVILAHIGTRATGLHGFGPRYLFVPCAISWILTARGAAVLAQKEGRGFPVAAVILGLLILSATAVIPARLSLYRGYNDVQSKMTRAAAALPSCSLVLFPEEDWRGWAEASPWLGLTGNHSAPLFAADLGETLGLEWCYPDRRIFRWTADRMIPVFDPAAPIP